MSASSTPPATYDAGPTGPALPSAPASTRSAPVRHAPLIVTAAILLVTAVIMFTQGRPVFGALNLAVILATAAPAVVERWARVRIPASLLTMYALLLLAAPWFGTTLDFYGTWSPWDTVVHGLSGIPIALGWIFVLGVTASRTRLVLSPGVEALVVAALSVLVAFVWEVCEFVSDLTIGTEAQYSNHDTMTDMIAGAIGGLVVVVALLLHRTRGAFPGLARYRAGA